MYVGRLCAPEGKGQIVVAWDILVRRRARGSSWRGTFGEIIPDNRKTLFFEIRLAIGRRSREKNSSRPAEVIVFEGVESDCNGEE